MHAVSTIRVTVLLSLVATFGAGCSSDETTGGGGGTLFLSRDNDANGLYTLDIATGTATLVGQSGVTSSTVGLAYDPTQGKLLGSRWATLLRINPDGSGYTDLGGTGTEGLAYDRVNNVLYGAINGAFFTMNKDTGAKIADQAAPGCDAEGLAFRATPPTVFAVCSNSGNLLAYDVGGGTWSVVGAHGLGNLGFGSGLAYDPHLDVLYLTGGLASPNLYWLDPGTGASTLIGTTGLASTNGGLEYAY